MPVIQPITSASSGSSYVPTSRTLSINGTAYDLTTDRSWTINGLSGLIATSPLVFNVGTSTLSIPAATSSVNGYLTSADWLTFSSKQPAITLTTTGNNGSATLIGATLNIPAYTLVGLGGMSNPFSAAIGQIIYSNSAGAPLSLSPNTTTTKKYLAMTGDGTNGAAPVWDTISGITGSGTTNYVAKFTSSSAVGNSLIFDNGTNVGINVATPAQKLNIQGDGVRLRLSTASNPSVYYFDIEQNYNSANTLNFYATGGNNILRWIYDTNDLCLQPAGANVAIGTTIANARLQVNGGGLATTGGTAFMLSAGLTNGRLDTYQAGTANCIHTFQDRDTYEISAGSTSGYVSGIAITGRSATLNPSAVRVFTRNTQRMQIGDLGQLQLNSYTSASSFTGTPTAYLACDSSGNIITSNPSSGRSARITFSAEVPNTWLSMPSALSFFDSSTGFVTQADLTAYNQVRLIVNKQATAGAASSKIILRYQATSGSPFTASSYSDIGTSEVSVAVNVANNILVSSWINMVSGAKDDVWITILGINGDGTTSPQFGNIYAEFRFN